MEIKGQHIIRNVCPICGISKSKCTMEGRYFLICPECGVHFRAKVLVEDARTGWDGDYYSKDEILRHHLLRKSGFRAIERMIINHTRRRGYLMDVGCGVGMFLEIAKERGWEISGVEPSRTAAIIARNRTGGQVYNEDFLALDSLGQVDVVCMFDVLRTVSEPKMFVARAYKILSMGGYFVIRESNAWYGGKQRIQSSPVQEKVYEYMQEWTPDAISKTLRLFGFTNVVVHPSPIFFDGNESIIYRLSKFILSIFLKSFSRFTRQVITPNLVAIAEKKSAL